MALSPTAASKGPPSLGVSLKYGSDWRSELDTLGPVGFEGIELAADAVGVISAGRVDAGRLAKLARRLADYPYWYTVHAPSALDLRDSAERSWHRDLLEASVRLAGEVNASRLVVHFEADSGVAEVEEQYADLLYAAADVAKEHDVLLCVENIEIERVRPVVEFIRSLAHPNVKMTFDVGHAWLAANQFGFDFHSALRDALPHVAHLHVSDNFGRFEQMRLRDFDRYKLISFKRLLMLGKGDLHLPLGYGSIPYETILPEFSGYQGTVVMECRFGQFPGENDQIHAMANERIGLIDTHVPDG